MSQDGSPTTAIADNGLFTANDGTPSQSFQMSQGDALARWQTMLTAANDINNLLDPYTLVPNTDGAFNSNSIAVTLLRAAGLPYLSAFVQDGTPGSTNQMLANMAPLYTGSNATTATVGGNTVITGYSDYGTAFQSVTTPQGSSTVSQYYFGNLFSTTSYASTDHTQNFTYTEFDANSGNVVNGAYGQDAGHGRVFKIRNLPRLAITVSATPA